MRDSKGRMLIPAVLTALLLTVAAIAALSMPGRQESVQAAQAPGGARRLPAPVMEVKQVMDLFMKPWYMDMKKDLKEKPDGNEAWKDIEEDALQAAEFANLIAIRKVPQSAEAALQKHAAELQNAGLALSKAAKSKNYDQTRKDWTNLVHACNGCHKELAADKGPQLQP